MPRACARSMIFARLPLQLFGRQAAQPSLPPSATIRMRTSPSSAQSSRDSPPADVSPETPAFTTPVVQPLPFRRSCSNADTRVSAGSPSPAVRLSPSTTMRAVRPFRQPAPPTERIANLQSVRSFCAHAAAADEHEDEGASPPTHHFDHATMRAHAKTVHRNRRGGVAVVDRSVSADRRRRAC